MTKKPELLIKIERDLPNITLVRGESFFWSPGEQTITYPSYSANETWAWAFLHEIAHAKLGHTTYKSDVELLMLEVAAWEHAKEIAPQFNVQIDEDHVQDCLDTYRDWLHRRSTCPRCEVVSLQQNSSSYRCINCGMEWQVSASRFCRPYRLTKKKSKEKSPLSSARQATFR